MKTTTYEVQDDAKVLVTETVTYAPVVTKRLLTPEQFQLIKDAKTATVTMAQDELAQIDAAATLSQQKVMLNQVKPSPVQLDNNIV